MRYRCLPDPGKLAPHILFLVLALCMPLRAASADSLPLAELHSLMDSITAMTPEQLQSTLPAYARYLQGGTIAIRGLLLAAAWESDDVVYSFRSLEIFAWTQDAPISACPPDSILRFRVRRSGVASIIERRRQGIVRPLEAGRQYWITTTSLNLHLRGDLSFSGMFPIEEDAILVDYAELERAGPGEQLTTHSASLHLPLPVYRECLAVPPSARASALLTALWSQREP